MFGWGKRRRLRAVGFDIIGTVFPLERLRPVIVSPGLPTAALEGWFATGLRDAFALSAAGDFAPLPEVGGHQASERAEADDAEGRAGWCGDGHDQDLCRAAKATGAAKAVGAAKAARSYLV